jgi:hypothetical protein
MSHINRFHCHKDLGVMREAWYGSSLP